MARLNDSQPPGGESIEALKKRYIRQNREIARANSQQSVRIRVLETEAGHLLEENISLREQVIKLTVELDRRNRSTELLHIVTNTKSALEKKLREMLKLVGEMNLQPQTQGRDKIVTRPKTADERVWRNEYLLKLEQEGLTPIKEDMVSPRKSLSIGDISVLTPAYPSSPQSHHSNDDGDLSPYLNIRPRRRRDSTFVPSSSNTVSPIDLPIHPKSDASPESKPPKRKFEFEDSSPQRRMSFGGASTVDDLFTYKLLSNRREQSILTKGTENNAEAATDGVLKREPWSAVDDTNRWLSGKSDSGESHKENKPQDEGNPTYLLAGPDKAEERKKRISLAGVSGNATPVLSPPQLPREYIDPEGFADIDVALKPRKSTTTTTSRKALGPKTANSGPVASPQKPVINITFPDPLSKLKALDFNPENQSFITTGCPIATENEAFSLAENITGTRLSRRTTANPINYALPRLNTKLRRETAEPEKPKKLRTSGTGGGRKSREGSAERSKERESRSRQTNTDSGIRWEREVNEEFLVLENAPRGRTTKAQNLTYPQSACDYSDSSPGKISSVSRGRSEDIEKVEDEDKDYQGITISVPAKRVSMSHLSRELPEERERGRSSFVGTKSSTGGVERRRSMMV